MRFIANNVDITIIETEQPTESEVNITADGEVVAYFDSDENEFVVYKNVLERLGLTVSVEDKLE